jgi:hypothetical protein
MPRPIEPIDFGLIQPLHTEVTQELIEGHSLENIELRPSQFADTNALHRRLVIRSPLVDEPRPINGHTLRAPKAWASSMMLVRQSTVVPKTSKTRAFTAETSEFINPSVVYERAVKVENDSGRNSALSNVSSGGLSF